VVQIILYWWRKTRILSGIYRYKIKNIKGKSIQINSFFTKKLLDNFTEEALKSHEKEIERLEVKYESLKNLHELVQSHMDLIKEIEEFEVKEILKKKSKK